MFQVIRYGNSRSFPAESSRNRIVRLYYQLVILVRIRKNPESTPQSNSLKGVNRFDTVLRDRFIGGLCNQDAIERILVKLR